MKNRDLIARITEGAETWREARMYVNRVQQLRNPWPCVIGHFDDALVEDGPCTTEVMARHQHDDGDALVWPDGSE